jgi:urea transporter
LRQDNLQMFLKGIPLTGLGYLIAQFVPSLPLRLALCSVIILVLLIWLPGEQEKRNGVAYLRQLLVKLSVPFQKRP